jgi:hypothetical protein
MTFRTRSGCYFNCGKPSRMPKSHFCSDKCASEWAEQMVEGNQDDWCVECQQWFSSGMLHNKECSTRKET